MGYRSVTERPTWTPGPRRGNETHRHGGGGHLQKLPAAQMQVQVRRAGAPQWFHRVSRTEQEKGRGGKEGEGRRLRRDCKRWQVRAAPAGQDGGNWGIEG